MTEIKNALEKEQIIDSKKGNANQIHDKKVSTFSEVHVNKNSLVQSHM
ncbi:hypothetical protein GYW21_04840 [Lactobacillus mellis]|nr:hypothetical protein [Bombilactobacillus mellis]